MKIILKSFAYLRFIILPFIIIYMMDRVDKKKLIIFLNLMIIFLILDIFFQFYFKVDFFGYRLDDLGNPRMDRISGFFGYELIAGTYLSLFGFLALFLLKELNTFNEKKYLYFIYSIFLISAILVTGDRVGVLFIFGIILFNILFNNNLRKYFFLSFLIFTLLGIAIIKNNEKLSERYIDKFEPVKNTKIFTNPSFEGIINSPWISHYLVSWVMIKEKPLLGFGNRGFRNYCNEFINQEKISTYKGKCTTHPHNTYFEILVETGIVGLVVFLLFNFIIFVKVFKTSNQNVFLVYSIIFTILNPLRPSGSFFTTWNGGIFWVILGILLYYILQSPNLKKRED
jgi:O-antigen ligase